MSRQKLEKTYNPEPVEKKWYKHWLSKDYFSADSKSSKELLIFMKSIVEELNQTIVMVTHDPYAASYAERVIILKDGEIANDLDKPSQEEIVSEVTALTDI